MVAQNKQSDGVALLAETAYTGSGTVNGDSVAGWRGVSAMAYEMTIVEVSCGEADTLDVSVQGSIDGSVWFKIYDFTQITYSTTPGTVMRVSARLDAVAGGGVAEFNSTAAAGTKPIFTPYYRIRMTKSISSGTVTISAKILPIFANHARAQD